MRTTWRPSKGHPAFKNGSKVLFKIVGSPCSPRPFRRCAAQCGASAARAASHKTTGAENPKCSDGHTLLSVKACNRVRSLPHSSRIETVSRVGTFVANCSLSDSDVPVKPRPVVISEFNGTAQADTPLSVSHMLPNTFVRSSGLPPITRKL